MIVFKKLVGLVFTFAMLFGLMSMTAFAAGEVIQIAGKNVYVSSGASYWVNNGSGGITKDGASADNYNVMYDAETKTLTLKDAAITAASGKGVTSIYGGQAYIHTEKVSVTINVIGNNTLGPASGSTAAAIIYTDIRDNKTLTFSGTGSLTGTGKYYGIYAYSNGTSNIVFNSGNYTFNVKDQGSGSPVIGASYTGKMTVNGGDVVFDVKQTSTSGNYNAIGIKGSAFDSGYKSSLFEINGGSCKVSAYDEKGNNVYAMGVGWKNCTFNGGSLELSAGKHIVDPNYGMSTNEGYHQAFDEYPNNETDGFKNATIVASRNHDGTNSYVVTDKNNMQIGKISYFKIGSVYTVTYQDGVEDEEVFANQVYENLLYGAATPAYEGTLTRAGYTFKGWTPEVADTVTGNAVYTATWEQEKYTVVYKDGVEDEEVFTDQVYEELLYGEATPAYEGTPERAGYTFEGWEPEVEETVTDNAEYVAIWEPILYTVTYKDGVDGEEVFADQVYEELLYGEATPAYEGTPERAGYTFKGWKPEVEETVTDNAVYEATWEKDEEKKPETPTKTPTKTPSKPSEPPKKVAAKTGDASMITLWSSMMAAGASGMAVCLGKKRKK